VRAYAFAAGAVFLTTIACFATGSLFDIADRAMLYLLGVLLLAARLSRGPSLFAALLSVAALDFFFVPPFYTFSVSNQTHFVTFGVLLVVGFIVSAQTVRIREHAESAHERERRTAALYAMSREFIADPSLDAIATAARRHVRELLGAETSLLLGPSLVPGGSPPTVLSARELDAARRAFELGQPTGRGTSALNDSESFFVPMHGARSVGVFGVAIGGRAALTPMQVRVLETFVVQTALAIERAQLSAEAEQTRLAVETERTRNNLLSAVSHDLRTPLSSIRGSAELLLDPLTLPAEEERRELLRAIRDEADRLAHLVTNLLELTRLESGVLRSKKDWIPIEEVIASALGRMQAAFDDRAVEVCLPDEMLFVPADPVLLEQALVHLLENASKHTPPGTAIEVRAHRTDGWVVIEVSDRGPGLPPGDEQRVFEKFFRVADRKTTPGAGLGLTVCQAIIHAHGGRLEAANRPEGGARFTIELPAEGEPPSLEGEPE
jgi:two-component system, OmpR family, sensor histidine kinase KdpD